MTEHEIEFSTGDNGDVVAEVELTEEECDVARGMIKVPLMEGAYSSGTSYHRNEDEFSFTVRAESKEKAKNACRAWLTEIEDELN